MPPVQIGIFSLSPPQDHDDDGSYLRWHLLDHMPEQFGLAGMLLAHRWIADGELRSARLAGEGPMADVAGVMQYYVGDPVEPTLEEFFVLGRRLAEQGRFPELRPSLGLRMLGLLRWYAAPSALISPEVVAHRPHRGVVLIIEEPARPLDAWLHWHHTQHMPELLAVPGVAGAGVYRRTGAWSIPERADGPDVVFTVVYLDHDPVATTSAATPAIEARWASGEVRPLFAGPLQSMVRWDAWP